jgi:ribonuclease Z
MIKVDVLYLVAGVATQVLLSHESGDLLVDAGDGVMRDLIDRNYAFYRLKAILLTHEDFDHVSGLYALLNFLKNFIRHRKERSETLEIVVPKPIHHVHLMTRPPLMYGDLGFPTRLLEVSQGESVQIAGFKIMPFAVDHQKKSRAGGSIGGNLGYSVVDGQGFKVVLSGDTRPCKMLEQETNGADIAVLEASARDQDIEKAIEHGHMTKSEAERIGRLAKRAIYVHQPPDWFV